MTGNAQKTPLQRSLNRAIQKRVNDELQLTGYSLPCSVVTAMGAIVTVKFEIQSGFTIPNVTCPVFGPEYIRYPLQAGDKGIVISADAQLGGISGLGTGVATLDAPANLGACVFLPIGNANFFSVDQNSLVLYGPDGTIIRSKTQSNINITVNGTTITLQFGSNSVVINSVGISLNGPIFFNGTVSGETTGAEVNFGAAPINTTGVLTAGNATIDGRSFSTHAHSGVQPGSSDTGPIV